MLDHVLFEPTRTVRPPSATEQARASLPRAAPPASEAAREGEALVQRWAPTFVQHASAANPERDLPLRIDFDGDWSATNNWQHLTPALREREPSVYYSAILTETHAYLTYMLFYPRDWIWPLCVDYICHDNDLEVALLVVTRGSAGGATDSRLVLIETKAHNSYVAAEGRALATTTRPWLE